MIKLLKSIRDFPAENSFILTYNLDLLFYEAAVFETLYGYGCRNSVIICDPHQYHTALQDSALLRYAGQRYFLFKGMTSPRGAFHPKLVFLTNKTAGRLFVASANLSLPGYTNNWEVLTEFKFNSRHPDPIAWEKFHWAFNLLEKIADASDHYGLLQARIDRLLGTTPWLRKELTLGESNHLWAIHNIEETLLDQIVEQYHRFDGSPVKDVFIVSPFFDSKARAFTALLNSLHPNQVNVFTQFGQGLCRDVIEQLQKEQSARLKFNSLLKLPRRLHAKAILFKTQKGVWLISGSANFSAPALLNTAKQGNTELLVLRFETQGAYYDDWLAELTNIAEPMDWDTVPEIEKDAIASTSSELILENALIHKGNLEVKLVPEPKAKSLLTVVVEEDEPSQVAYSHWNKTPEGWISLPCSEEFREKFEAPTLISVQAIQDDGNTLQTNSVLLHNLDSLEKFSKPLHKNKRATIPDGLITENAATYAELLEIIQGLVITNQEQLERHNPHIVTQRKQEKEELEITEEYNPESHIVPELIRRPLVRLENSGDLYTDYEERLTYQEILGAVLSVIYQPEISHSPEKTVGLEDLSFDTADTLTTDATITQAVDSEEAKAYIKKRISSSFKRIIENFSQGLSDSEYLETVPKVYLLELWTIISSLLRVIWSNDLLSDEDFQGYSLTLLYSFWGRASQEGAWQQIKVKFDEAEKEREFSRLSLSLNLWMHVMALAKCLERISDRRLFDVAGSIRYLLRQSFSFENLEEYPESAYWRSWDTSFSQNTARIKPGDFVQHLWQLSQKYDTSSLKDEIKRLAGSLPFFDFGMIAEISHVPRMFISFPLSDKNLDLCWEIYQQFFFHPSPKKIAWARFINANPCIEDQDIQQVTVFYNGDKRFLLFAIKRQKSDASEEIEAKNFLMEALRKIDSVDELRTYQY